MTSASSSGSAQIVQLDPTLLEQAGKNFADLETKVGGILSSLVANIDSLGTPWGDDSNGQQFANGSSGYLAAVAGLVGSSTGALPQYQTLFTSFGQDVVGAASAFLANDDALAQQFLSALNSSGSSSTGSGSTSTSGSSTSGSGSGSTSGSGSVSSSGSGTTG